MSKEDKLIPAEAAFDDFATACLHESISRSWHNGNDLDISLPQLFLLTFCLDQLKNRKNNNDSIERQLDRFNRANPQALPAGLIMIKFLEHTTGIILPTKKVITEAALVKPVEANLSAIEAIGQFPAGQDSNQFYPHAGFLFSPPETPTVLNYYAISRNLPPECNYPNPGYIHHFLQVN